jgi:hypothetical protein
MFSIFNSKKRIFKRNLMKAAKAVQILSTSSFKTSLNSQDNARKQLKEINDQIEILEKEENDLESEDNKKLKEAEDVFEKVN